MADNQLRITLPQDLSEKLEEFLETYQGWRKTDIVTQALRQFIALKNHERKLKEEHGGSPVEVEVNFRVGKPQKADRMASVLMY